jgi:hypothetical protein
MAALRSVSGGRAAADELMGAIAEVEQRRRRSAGEQELSEQLLLGLRAKKTQARLAGRQSLFYVGLFVFPTL